MTGAAEVGSERSRTSVEAKSSGVREEVRSHSIRSRKWRVPICTSSYHSEGRVVSSRDS